MIISMIRFDPFHYLDPLDQKWSNSQTWCLREHLQVVSTCFNRHFVAESQHNRKLRGSAHAPCRGLGECPCRCPAGYTARVVHWDPGVRRGSLLAPVFPVTSMSTSLSARLLQPQ